MYFAPLVRSTCLTLQEGGYLVPNKRLFTHHMQFALVIAGADWVYTPSADQFLAQENLDIIGLELNIELCSYNQNDSVSMAYVEISQNGNWNQDGMLMREQAVAAWNTAPAFGYYVKGFRSQFFPAGYAVPLKEEGVLYMHVQSQGAAAGTTSLAVHCNVFYAKR